MFTAEVSRSTGIGSWTETFEAPVKFELAEWNNGVVVQATMYHFIYVPFNVLTSVILSEEKGENAPEG